MNQRESDPTRLPESFFDLSPDLLGIFDAEGRFVRINAAYEKLLGYLPEDLIGKHYRAIAFPDDTQKIEAGLARLKSAGTVQGIELRCLDVQGEVHWFEVSARQTEEGLIFIVSRDISERVRLAERSRQLEQKLVESLTSMTDAFFMLDPDWRFTFINGEAERTLQVKASELLGRSLWECFPEAVGSAFEDEYRAAFADGGPTHFEAYFSPLELWVEVHAYPSLNGLAVYFRNINNRVFARRHMRILERSINASMNGILIVDAQAEDYPIVFANSAFGRITGYDPQDVIGRNCRFLQGEHTNQTTRKKMREAIRKGSEAHVVIENYRKDGALFWNELYLSPVVDEQGVITHYIGVQNDISSLRETRQQLAYKTHHDALTGLPNSELFADRVAQALRQVRQPGQAMALLLLDLDDARQLMEKAGLSAFQNATVEIANRLQSCLDTSETLGRLDSNRFAILIPERPLHAMEQLSESILECFSEPLDAGEELIRVTATQGMAYARRTDSDPHELLRRAHIALMHAKDDGQERSAVYNIGMEEPLNQRRHLRRRLHQAVSDEAFTLVYQPLIDARDGRIVGAELLLRWHDAELGQVSPSQFIPAAEAEGLIGVLTDQLIRQLLAELQTSLRQWRSVLRFSLNISPLMLAQDFPEHLSGLLEGSELSPDQLELELTETVLMDENEKVPAILGRLQALGFSIAIDDFGTGFTGLTYLKNLPIDTLKIDRTFIEDVVRDGRDSTIVESIVYLAHNMEMTVVAEGVETVSQALHLSRANVDLFQGYLFAKPMAAAALAEFMTAQSPRPGFVQLPADPVVSRVKAV